MNVVEPVEGNEDHGADQIGTVVHGDVRLVIEGRGHVFVVSVGILAVDGEDGEAEIVHQAGSHVVLGGKRVGGDQHQVGAAGLQGAAEVSGLGRDVQAGSHAQPGQRLLLGEALADAGQHRHVLVGPEDALLAAGGQFRVRNVAALERGSSHS